MNLYYSTRGSGPLLLILQGGAGNGESSEALANELDDDFSVVTYDRRGLSRSTPTQSERYEIAAHAEDAARLIAALSREPVFVFGSSIGAVIGLELVAHHPACVRRLIAHEPPVYRLLEGAEQQEALLSHSELRETFRREGKQAALKLMVARSGVDINDRVPQVPLPVAAAADRKDAAQRLADLQHFFTWDMPAVTRYQPDIAALTAARDKIVPAIGAGSPLTRPYKCAVKLAQVLGVSAVEFPGGHTGYVLRPKAFAAKLHDLLRLTAIPPRSLRSSRPADGLREIGWSFVKEDLRFLVQIGGTIIDRHRRPRDDQVPARLVGRIASRAREPGQRRAKRQQQKWRGLHRANPQARRQKPSWRRNPHAR